MMDISVENDKKTLGGTVKNESISNKELAE